MSGLVTDPDAPQLSQLYLRASGSTDISSLHSEQRAVATLSMTISLISASVKPSMISAAGSFQSASFGMGRSFSSPDVSPRSGTGADGSSVTDPRAGGARTPTPSSEQRALPDRRRALPVTL